MTKLDRSLHVIAVPRLPAASRGLLAILVLAACGGEPASSGDTAASAPTTALETSTNGESTPTGTDTSTTSTTSTSTTGTDTPTTIGTDTPTTTGASGSEGLTGSSTTSTGDTSGEPESSSGEPVDPCAPNPCVDPPPAACEGSVLVGAEPEGVCTVESGLAKCDYPVLETDCAAASQACQGGACVAPGKPGVGAVIFVELMPDPVGLSDYDGEWIELKNVSDQPVDLDGCRLVDLVVAQNDHVIDAGGPLILAAGARMVMAKTIDPQKNGGIAGVVQGFGEDFSLTNTGDTAILRCNDTDVDTVAFVPGSWPYGVGVAMALDPSAETAAGNDAAGAWCAASAAYFEQNYGTPGLANPSCR